MPPASTFIGRTGAVARLVELVSQAPLVTVTGPGGVGKTRLVHEAAPILATDLTEAVWFRELAPLPAGSDVDTVSSEAGFASPEVAAVALAEQSAVLVLDNCEHVLDAAASFVTRVLAQRNDVRIVTTSREPLAIDGEQVLVLAPLELPAGDVDAEASAAVRLFLDRATAAGAAVDRSPRALATVAELCRRLDGLPLAIELAAARSRAVAPAELLTSMDRRLDVLRRSQRRGPARHDSMRAAIDISVDLLDDDDRTTFSRLGVFAGPFTTDLAHGVLAGDGRDRLRTLDQLARLVDRSLLVAEPAGGVTRYRMLELLRERAVDALVETGERERMQDRFVSAMVDDALIVIADALDGWSGEILARMALQFHNLLAAIEWCIGHDDGPDRA